MKDFRKELPVTVSLFLAGIWVGLVFLLLDNAWTDFRWSSVLIGLLIGLSVTTFEIVQFRKKRQQQFKRSKKLYSVGGVIYILLGIAFEFIPGGNFYQAQLLMILCILLITFSFCFKIHEFCSGNHGTTWGDIE